MAKEYGKPVVRPIRFDFDVAPLVQAEAYMTLSRKDVLGIVQSAYDELGSQNPALVAIKRDVLSEVSEGKLAKALHTAILGAGKTCCACCR